MQEERKIREVYLPNAETWVFGQGLRLSAPFSCLAMRLARSSCIRNHSGRELAAP